MNDSVPPVFAEHEVPLLPVLIDRATKFCGAANRHPYELYPRVEDIEHSRTKTKHPQTEGAHAGFTGLSHQNQDQRQHPNGAAAVAMAQPDDGFRHSQCF